MRLRLRVFIKHAMHTTFDSPAEGCAESRSHVAQKARCERDAVGALDGVQGAAVHDERAGDSALRPAGEDAGDDCRIQDHSDAGGDVQEKRLVETLRQCERRRRRVGQQRHGNGHPAVVLQVVEIDERTFVAGGRAGTVQGRIDG